MFGESWDYIVIGSNGFAQLGQPDYVTKQKAEKEVLLPFAIEKLPIPEEFQGVCHFAWKRFPYEYDSYHELVLNFNTKVLDTWEDQEEEKFDRFWDFANEAEVLCLDSEELTEQIQAKYNEILKERGDFMVVKHREVETEVKLKKVV